MAGGCTNRCSRICNERVPQVPQVPRVPQVPQVRQLRARSSARQNTVALTSFEGPLVPQAFRARTRMK